LLAVAEVCASVEAKIGMSWFQSATPDAAMVGNVTFYRNGERFNSTLGVVWTFPSDIATISLTEVLSRLARTNPELIDPSKVANTTIRNDRGVQINATTHMAAGNDYFLLHSSLLWMWSPINIGHKVSIEPSAEDEGHLPGDHNLMLETLGISPKVFYLHNLLTDAEAEALLTHNRDRMSVSTVGSKKARADIGRTSTNTWDHSSEAAVRVIKRAYHMLRIPYHPNSVDGLQVVRYGQGQFYNEHFDFLETSNANEFNNMIPTKGGTNRYATIFLYMSDVEVGGMTGFPKANPLSSDELNRISPDLVPMVNYSIADFNRTVLEQALGRPNGMEMNMGQKCFSRFGVRPKKLGAVLFYNTLPDQYKDEMAFHSGCPVLEGTKWAANLWVWTGNREGKGIPTQIVVKFFNKYPHSVDLKWVASNELKDSGVIQAGHSMPVNTFNNHRFEFHYQGKVLDSFHVNFKNGVEQQFTVPSVGDQEPFSDPSVTFQNEGNEDLDVFWIPPNGGAAVSTGSVKMHDQIVHKTHHTHVFEFRSAKDSHIVGRHTVDGRKGASHTIMVPSGLDSHQEL
jgi:prolyl 4-hydroxylase